MSKSFIFSNYVQNKPRPVAAKRACWSVSDVDEMEKLDFEFWGKPLMSSTIIGQMPCDLLYFIF